MADMGIVMSGGSDAPCTYRIPFSVSMPPAITIFPEQSLSIQEALKIFTYNAAWTTFDEKDRGSLEKGKVADMVILNRDPLAMKPAELLNLKVEKLILNGMPYKKGQSIMSLLAKGFTA